MKKYTLEVSETQLKVIQESLEFTSRFSAGQSYLPNFLNSQLYEKLGEEFLANRNHWEHHFKEIKTSMFPELAQQESLGIGNKELAEEAKIAYDIYRPILELFNKDSEHWNVYSSPGMSLSKEGRVTPIEVNNTPRELTIVESYSANLIQGVSKESADTELLTVILGEEEIGFKINETGHIATIRRIAGLSYKAGKEGASYRLLSNK